MMSKQMYKLHPISSIINFLKGLKELIVPIAIIFLSRLLNTSDEMNFWTDLFPILIIGIPIIFYLFSGIIKWWTFVYWFEDEELRVEYGLFIKKKKYIPFERIQSLNYKEGIFHQLLGLVQVMIETAGSTNGKPEVELTAITKVAAKQIEDEMDRAKNLLQTEEEHDIPWNGGLVSKSTVNIVHKMSNKDLLLLATTSNSIGVVLAGIIALLSQFSEYIPFEFIYEEIGSIIQYGVVTIMFMIMVCLLLAWLLSIAITYFNYYDFSVIEESEKMIVTRGLLEKKKVTIPLNRVQAIKIIENPLRQIFGYASVVVESAGGATSEKDKKMILFPLIKKRRLYRILNNLFPQFEFELELQMINPPQKAKAFFYRADFIWLIPVIGICAYFYFPLGFLSVLLVIPIVLLGIWQFKTTGYAIKDNQLTIVYRIFSRVTFMVEKKRIQVIERKQNFFQKRRRIATIQATVMSGFAGSTAKASHLNEEQANIVLDWFENRKRGAS